jgi:hypothetical protein
MHFEQISSTIGTPIEVIRGLNPQFIKDIVPAVNGRSYDIVLPLSEIGKFMDHEEEIMNKDVIYLAEYMSPRKNGEMPKFVIDSKTHVVKSGENLSLIAKKYGVSVLLKNAVSILTDGERTLVNTTGTAGQAKGGSGDVLAGVIAGLCGGGLSVFDGGTVGSYLTGRSAELLKETHGDYSLLASDVVGGLGKAFLDLFAENADDEGDDE